MANHGPVYGLDAELAAKQAGKRDPKQEAEVKQYIQQLTGHTVTDLHEDLKSGVVLCECVVPVQCARACDGAC